MTEKKRNFIVRTITGVLYVAIMVAGMLSAFSMIVLFALITGLAIWEFSGLVNEREGVSINRFIVTVAGVYFFVAVAGILCGFVNTLAAFIPYLLTLIYLFISELYTRPADAIHDWAYSALSQFYIALPLSSICALAFTTSPESSGVSYHYLLPLSVFIFLWLNDTGAYLTGSLIGKHKLFPSISPGKTWEGSTGGAVLVVIAAAVIYFVEERLGSNTGLNLLQWIGLGLIVVFFGTWGDLVESLLKRTLGIKDSGNILPGHGGMLDRFDSSLMAIPAVVIYLYTLQLF